MISFVAESATLLAAAGIAWDISGGVALSRGLILDNDTLRRRAGSYWGSSPPAIRGLCEQRLDAKFGLAQLLFGFSLQLLSGIGINVSLMAAIGLSVDIAAAWPLYRYNLPYWVAIASLRHAESDTTEDAWRRHFLDIPEMTWRSAVIQLGLEFKPPPKPRLDL